MFSPLKRFLSKKETSFVHILEQYLEYYANENNLTPPTLKKYHQLINNIHSFLKFKRMLNARCLDIRPKLMDEYRSWLSRNLKSCSISHASRNIELCKRTLRYAVTLEIIPYSPIEHIKTGRDKVKTVVSLELPELVKIMKYKFANPIFELTADYYVFQASTGLSYCDVQNYTLQELDGEIYICGERNKTKRKYWVPLFVTAEILHEKYNGEFPYIANATYNRMLKEIAVIVGIEKKLTSHTARKTFATLKYVEGWSKESIMDMMGISTSEVLSNHYITKDHKRIASEYLQRKSA